MWNCANFENDRQKSITSFFLTKRISCELLATSFKCSFLVSLNKYLVEFIWQTLNFFLLITKQMFLKLNKLTKLSFWLWYVKIACILKSVVNKFWSVEKSTINNINNKNYNSFYPNSNEIIAILIVSLKKVFNNN